MSKAQVTNLRQQVRNTTMKTINHNKTIYIFTNNSLKQNHYEKI
jgi:hypothetical protein